MTVYGPLHKRHSEKRRPMLNVFLNRLNKKDETLFLDGVIHNSLPRLMNGRVGSNIFTNIFTKSAK